jgi:soluble lytic murein transglycosylase
MNKAILDRTGLRRRQRSVIAATLVCSFANFDAVAQTTTSAKIAEGTQVAHKAAVTKATATAGRPPEKKTVSPEKTLPSEKTLHADAVRKVAANGAIAETREAVNSGEQQAPSRWAAVTVVPLPRARLPLPAPALLAACKNRADASAIGLAEVSVPETSDVDIALVRTAIDSLCNGDAAGATQIEVTISDPAARQLVAWIIFHGHGAAGESARHDKSAVSNPSWPSLLAFPAGGARIRSAENRDSAPAPDVVSGRGFASDATSKSGQITSAGTPLAPPNSQARGACSTAGDDGSSPRACIKPKAVESASIHATGMRSTLPVGKPAPSDRVLASDANPGPKSHSPVNGVDPETRAGNGRVAQNKETPDVASAGKRTNTPAAGMQTAPSKTGVNAGVNGRQAFASVSGTPPEDLGRLLARVRVLRQQDRIPEAAQAMLTAPQDTSQQHDRDGWWIERRLLARKLLDVGDSRTAYAIVQSATDPVEERHRVERHFLAGWITLRFLDDPNAAGDHFARIAAVSRQSTSLARCHYWLARAAEAAGRSDEARAEYETAARFSDAYYGQLARARIGIGSLALPMSPMPTPTVDRAGKKRSELARALEILYALNEHSLVVSLVTDVGNELDDVGAILTVGEIAERHQDARAMLELGSAATARGLPLYTYAFPTVGVPSYFPVGPDVDRAALLAVIRQESAFNSEDLSRAGAIGLMQVTPAAAQDTCRRFSCSFDLDRLRSDIVYNLQLGAAELGSALRDYKGNYILALAAYNAGRGAVAQWIDRFGDPRDPKVDPIDWVERIPFAETRNYVQRVLENLQVYRLRIDQNAPLTIEHDLRGGVVTN